MSKADPALRIAELEEALRQKDAEIQKYRHELARTNQSLERLIGDLTQELKWVSVIQKALSPTQLPQIQGFEFSTKFVPGAQVGGDYFDIFEHDDKLKFGVLMSSASGYALSALFLSVLLKLSNRIEARKGLSPQKALELICREMQPNMVSKDEAQIFYGVMDRRTMEFRYSALGAPALFHWIAASQQLVRLESTVKPLSAQSEVSTLEHGVQLGARDRIVLCSEGVVEAPNPDGKPFGMEPLQSAILRTGKMDVHQVRNEILFQLEKFTETQEPLRDLTVLVLEVSDRVIKLAK